MGQRCLENEASVAHVMKHKVPALGLLNAHPDQHHYPRDLARLSTSLHHIIVCIDSAGAVDRFGDELKLFYRCLARIESLMPVAA